MFILEIADTGIGISDQREALGRGLQIMAYRAGLIGAVLSIRRSDSGGTLVSCSLPQGSC
jgi:nitrate/nitrite-specific signal transduction histidine kinase